jgi:dienelactone hydrolase
MRLRLPSSVALVATLVATLLACTSASTRAQSSAAVNDVVIPPGANFDKAIFRVWLPPGVATVRAVLVLTPGSNGDGRDAVSDTVWQAFATSHQLALVASQLTDKPHEQGFIESYVDVSKGTGQALLDALTQFAGATKHAELATAPLLLWGMSAGGQFNYEFTAWKPERVMAFVVNKGGIYYSALVPAAARRVPGLLFIGGKDLEFRTNTIVGLFAVNRRAGALWALAEEPSAAHIVGRSRDVAMVFFDDVLTLRGPAMRPLTENSGWLGDLKAHTIAPLGDAKVPGYPTAWLPSERVAKAWRAMVTEAPPELE